jgi:hypothetical protein
LYVLQSVNDRTASFSIKHDSLAENFMDNFDTGIKTEGYQARYKKLVKDVSYSDTLNPGTLSKEETQTYKELVKTGNRKAGANKTYVDVLYEEDTQSTAEVMSETPKETLVRYTPKGKEEQVYAIRGSNIFNKDGKEVFKENGVDRNKIFANLDVQQKRAVVVEYDGTKYIVNNNDKILSGKTGKIMQWDANNGNRIAILKLASDKFAMNSPEGLPSTDRSDKNCNQ